MVRPQTGHHEIAVFPRLVRRFHFMAGAYDAIETGLARQIGQPHDLVMGRSANAGRGHVLAVQAGQQGHGHHLGVFARRRLGVFHHRASAAGMHGDDRRLEHMHRLHGLGDGVGNVMQLKVEKDRQADMRDFMHAVMAIGAEKFETELEAAYLAFQLLRDGQRIIQMRRVQRNEQGIGHSEDPPVLLLESPSSNRVPVTGSAGAVSS